LPPSNIQGTALLRQRLAVIAQDSPLERSAQKLAHIKQLFFNAYGYWPGQQPIAQLGAS
jgi:hypothetical protein